MQALADKYKLPFRLTKIGCDGDCEYIAQGELGLLYTYDDQEEELVGAMFIPAEPRQGWTKRQRELVAAGAHTVQNGDTEGAVCFPASDKKLVRLAAKLMGVKTTRGSSAKQLAALAKARAKSPLGKAV